MDKPVDRLRQLDCFRRVIEHGSISAAARALGVGQPAVSKQLRALEERLGVRLLERSTRGLEATPAGSGLYAGLPRLFEELEMLEDDVAASARGLSGLLRFHAPVAFGETHLTRELIRFYAEHPRIVLHVVYDDRYVDLVKERADVALRIGTLSSPDLVARKLAVLPRVLVASPRYLRTKGRPKSPEDLRAHNYVRNTARRQENVLVLTRGAERVELALESGLLVNNVFAVKDLLLAHAGVGQASRCFVDAELASGRLVEVLKDWSVASSTLYVVYPSRTLKTRRVNALVEFLAARLVTLPGVLAPSAAHD
jgi:DNA-binding transcriptional LysR family regulator